MHWVWSTDRWWHILWQEGLRGDSSRQRFYWFCWWYIFWQSYWRILGLGIVWRYWVRGSILYHRFLFSFILNSWTSWEGGCSRRRECTSWRWQTRRCRIGWLCATDCFCWRFSPRLLPTSTPTGTWSTLYFRQSASYPRVSNLWTAFCLFLPERRFAWWRCWESKLALRAGCSSGGQLLKWYRHWDCFGRNLIEEGSCCGCWGQE